MVVVTPTNPIGGSVGIATLDCSNLNPNNIAFVFAGGGQSLSPDAIPAVVAREFAFTIGLGQVDGPGDVMNQTSVEADAVFTGRVLAADRRRRV